jgi:hypothetical protein
MASQPDAGAVAGGQPGDRLAAPGHAAETSQVPFTPVTPEALAKLEPAERLAFTVASAQVARDENPGINTTAALVLTVQRLITERTALADADNAIGQVIRLAESWQMQEGHLDAPHAARVLLDICAAWTGGLRIDAQESSNEEGPRQ